MSCRYLASGELVASTKDAETHAEADLLQIPFHHNILRVSMMQGHVLDGKYCMHMFAPASSSNETDEERVRSCERQTCGDAVPNAHFLLTRICAFGWLCSPVAVDACSNVPFVSCASIKTVFFARTGGAHHGQSSIGSSGKETHVSAVHSGARLAKSPSSFPVLDTVPSKELRSITWPMRQ